MKSAYLVPQGYANFCKMVSMVIIQNLPIFGNLYTPAPKILGVRNHGVIIFHQESLKMMLGIISDSWHHYSSLHQESLKIIFLFFFDTMILGSWIIFSIILQLQHLPKEATNKTTTRHHTAKHAAFSSLFPSGFDLKILPILTKILSNFMQYFNAKMSGHWYKVSLKF